MTNQPALNADNEASPMTQTEQAVALIWAEVLQQPAVTPADNFLELGGDSMMMMIVLFRISEELGVELPSGVLLESPSLADFCQLIDKARRQERAPDALVLANTDQAPHGLSHEEGVV